MKIYNFEINCVAIFNFYFRKFFNEENFVCEEISSIWEKKIKLATEIFFFLQISIIKGKKKQKK